MTLIKSGVDDFGRLGAAQITRLLLPGVFHGLQKLGVSFKSSEKTC